MDETTTPMPAKNKVQKIPSLFKVAEATNIVINSSRKDLPSPFKQYARKTSLTPRANKIAVNNEQENGGIRLFEDRDWN